MRNTKKELLEIISQYPSAEKAELIGELIKMTANNIQLGISAEKLAEGFKEILEAKIKLEEENEDTEFYFGRCIDELEELKKENEELKAENKNLFAAYLDNQ